MFLEIDVIDDNIRNCSRGGKQTQFIVVGIPDSLGASHRGWTRFNLYRDFTHLLSVSFKLVRRLCFVILVMNQTFTKPSHRDSKPPPPGAQGRTCASRLPIAGPLPAVGRCGRSALYGHTRSWRAYPPSTGAGFAEGTLYEGNQAS